jgi:hypothetical protein
MVMRRIQRLKAPIKPVKGQKRAYLCTRLHKPVTDSPHLSPAQNARDANPGAYDPTEARGRRRGRYFRLMGVKRALVHSAATLS